MAITPETLQQLQSLPPEQLEQLKQALIAQRPHAEENDRKKILMRGITRGASAFGQGALLGFQGRPISELKLPENESNKYEELLRTEQLKNQLDPSRRAAQLELDNIQRQQEEQASGQVNRLPIDEQVGQIAQAQETGQPTVKTDAAPQMFIEKPKGKNKYGIMEYETIENPEYTEYIKGKGERETKQKETEMVLDAANDTLSTVKEIKNRLKYFGAAGSIPPLPGEYEKVEWRANYEKLTAKLALDLITRLKQASKTGATGFGALNEKELELLQAAPSALRRNMSEESALKYLNQIEAVANKVLKGNVQSGQQQPDNSTLPPEITTTSQAVQYLIQQGMTKEEAINWIRSQ